jgi:hypothetical protein
MPHAAQALKQHMTLAYISNEFTIILPSLVWLSLIFVWMTLPS